MNVVRKIFIKLNGMHYKREYICFPLGKHIYSLHVLLENRKNNKIDITKKHVMVGIKPLILALPEMEEVDLNSIESIYTSYVSTYPAEVTISTKQALAWLKLKKIFTQKTDEGNIYYFEAFAGEHKFIPQLNKKINRLYNNLFNKKQNNIFLNNNLYTFIQIAYSIPKIISLVSVTQHGKYNLFPNDQHGCIYKDHYIITLRKDGKACEQVTATGNVVISNISSEYYKQVYAFGKNHMQPFREKELIDFSESVSKYEHIPLPHKTISYKELEMIDSFIYGTHKVFLFKINYEEKISDESLILATINNAYATWRYKHKQPCEYFLL